MKICLTTTLIASSFAVLSQTTIPHSYLKSHIHEIDNDQKAKSKADEKPKYFYWLPSIFEKEYFDKERKYFQNNVISYNDSLSNIALYSELAADFIGPVRIGVGVTLSYPKTDTTTVEQEKLNKEKFVQRFTTGGGSVVFNFTLPIFAIDRDYFGTTMSFAPRLSIDQPTFGVSSKKFSFNTGIGTDIQADVVGIRKIIKFYGSARFSYIAGNPSFYNALSLIDNNRKGFFLNNYIIGVNIKDVFTLSYTKYWGSKNIRDRLSEYLTFTVEPNF